MKIVSLPIGSNQGTYACEVRVMTNMLLNTGMGKQAIQV